MRPEPVHYDDLLCCSCSRCGALLLGISPKATHLASRYFVGGYDTKPLPPTTYMRVHDRPICEGCHGRGE